MAGQLLQVVPKRVFDFSNSATGSAPKITVAQRIDVSKYVDCMVAVRLHSSNVAGGSSISVDVYGDGYTADDPGLLFQTAAPLFASQSITAAGPLLLTYGGTVPGRFVSVVVSANKAVGGAASATISVDLVLRCPDDA